MKITLGLTIAALALTACGGGDGKEASPPAETVTMTPTETTPAAPEGESDGCLVAANKWADRMTSHVLHAATTAPVMGESLDVEDLDDPTSEAKALCSEALTQAILEANAKFAGINYELALCAFDGTCSPAKTRKIRKWANQTATMVGDVRGML